MFNVGDTVKIIKKVDNATAPNWHPKMDQTIGEVGVVIATSNTTSVDTYTRWYKVRFPELMIHWWYCFESIESLELTKEKPMKEIIEKLKFCAPEVPYFKDLTPEEQDCLRKVGKEHCECYSEDYCDWRSVSGTGSNFCSWCRYRIIVSYKPKTIIQIPENSFRFVLIGKYIGICHHDATLFFMPGLSDSYKIGNGYLTTSTADFVLVPIDKKDVKPGDIVFHDEPTVWNMGDIHKYGVVLSGLGCVTAVAAHWTLGRSENRHLGIELNKWVNSEHLYRVVLKSAVAATTKA